MYQQIKELVKQFCIENGRYHVNVEKSLYLNRVYTLNDGCTCMFFEDGKSEPTLVAKGAYSDKRKIEYRVEFQVLSELQRLGINKNSPMTPTPLAIWDDGDCVVTLESALSGIPVKNLPARVLLSPKHLSTTIDQVIDWWKNLQSIAGIKNIRITDLVYRRDVIDQLDRYCQRFITNNIDLGINKNSPMTPTPLAIWDDGDCVVTLESALSGIPVKNLPARVLLSPKHLSTTIDQVIDWWKNLQSIAGIKNVRITDSVYRRDIIDQLDRYCQRFITSNIEIDFLEQRLLGRKRLLGLKLPYMVRHTDFVTGNMVVHSQGIGVFDWEFPLIHRLPLFDLFTFFSSLRYPYRGNRGASGHFKSFLCVFWEDNYINKKVRNGIQDQCQLFDIPVEAVGDLFLIALIQMANVKFDSLLSRNQIKEHDTTAKEFDIENKRLIWNAFKYPDKDQPFARIQGGASENIRYIANNGLPNFEAKPE